MVTTMTITVRILLPSARSRKRPKIRSAIDPASKPSMSSNSAPSIRPSGGGHSMEMRSTTPIANPATMRGRRRRMVRISATRIATSGIPTAATQNANPTSNQIPKPERRLVPPTMAVQTVSPKTAHLNPRRSSGRGLNFSHWRFRQALSLPNTRFTGENKLLAYNVGHA